MPLFSTTIDSPPPFLDLKLSTSKQNKKTQLSLQYKRGEPLRLWVNKVGPYNNPQQTYYYDTLPLCRPESKKDDNKKKPPARKRGLGLGEIIGGNRLVDSQLELAFLEPVPRENQRVCSQVLDAAAVESLSKAVRNHYWFELFLDDLPVSCFDFFSVFSVFFFFLIGRREKKKLTSFFFSLEKQKKTIHLSIPDLGLYRQSSLSGFGRAAHLHASGL